MNRKLVRRFDAGKITEAILGDGDMFLADHDDSTRHDYLLVLGQLVAWSDDAVRRSQAREGIRDAVSKSVLRQELPDALDIVWCLLILANDSDVPMPVDWQELLAEIELPVQIDRRIETSWKNRVMTRLSGQIDADATRTHDA